MLNILQLKIEFGKKGQFRGGMIVDWLCFSINI